MTQRSCTLRSLVSDEHYRRWEAGRGLKIVVVKARDKTPTENHADLGGCETRFTPRTRSTIERPPNQAATQPKAIKGRMGSSIMVDRKRKGSTSRPLGRCPNGSYKRIITSTVGQKVFRVGRAHNQCQIAVRSRPQTSSRADTIQ